jgi:hypothetical protein
VRAAEDGRTGPLPTLEECIQRQAQYVSFGNSGSLSGDSDQNWHSASVGGEAVAWMCEWTDYVGLHQSKTDAEAEALGDVIPQPLYREPPQPRGWLTEVQRFAIEDAIGPLRESGKYACENRAGLLQELLLRSSPPEVVLPGTQVRYHNISVEDQRDAQWIAALAAAGVAVKEVGRE